MRRIAASSSTTRMCADLELKTQSSIYFAPIRGPEAWRHAGAAPDPAEAAVGDLNRHKDRIPSATSDRIRTVAAIGEDLFVDMLHIQPGAGRYKPPRGFQHRALCPGEHYNPGICDTDVIPHLSRSAFGSVGARPWRVACKGPGEANPARHRGRLFEETDQATLSRTAVSVRARCE